LPKVLLLAHFLMNFPKLISCRWYGGWFYSLCNK